jgi:c-di-GMP-binding flagellar brake protein YcgR
MKLALRDFADVITALKGPGQKSGAGSEKRGAARMSVTAKINIHLLDNQRVARSFSVLTRDISITGMGVLQSIALSSNQNVIVELPRPQSPLFVICVVMHCRPLADGLLAVGLEYTEMASKETCDLLVNNDSEQHARIRESVLR